LQESKTKSLKKSSKITIAKIDAEKNPESGKKYTVKGFPTLLLFNNGVVIGEYESGDRTLTKLLEFIEERTQITYSKGRVVELTDQDFDSKTSLIDSTWLIKYIIITKKIDFMHLGVDIVNKKLKHRSTFTPNNREISRIDSQQKVNLNKIKKYSYW
jgi:hypothetical protein